ncbi:hypothetical protein C9374_007865 [Naegleria lovaniensis]|uniref:G-protein coupled receptors family 3 profile domain-containing protein n=1 Tax=Naegleria lovaniensis TaxID=51637 RepID=A0AA88KFW9_NAELO|nr:uncharacterized protein C9374_007865 [Naegleria lovaniensis]KAG2378717.1 hypothetical protein C9374_007865 [Naegleria lovaniensis]
MTLDTPRSFPFQTSLQQQPATNDSFNPFGFHPVEPQTPIDLAAVGFGGSVLLFNFCCMSLVFSKYKSMAVKTKHPILMMFSLIFNALLFIGYCFNNLLLYPTNYDYCVVFRVWFFNIGLFGWISCLLTRLLVTYITFKTQKKIRFPISLFIALFMIPIFVYCLVASIVKELLYDPKLPNNCKYGTIAVGVNLAMITLYCLIIGVLIFLSRKVQEDFNSSGTEAMGLVGIVVSVVIGLLAWLLYLHRIIPIRIIITLLPIIIGCYYFWSYFGGIVYAIVTCSSEEYFLDWLENQNVHDVATNREIQEELRECREKLRGMQCCTLSTSMDVNRILN